MDDSLAPELGTEDDPLQSDGDGDPPAPASNAASGGSDDTADSGGSNGNTADDGGDGSGSTGGTEGSGGASSEVPASGGTGGTGGTDATEPPISSGGGGGTDPALPLPDLVLDAGYLEATIQQAVVDATLDQCLIDERCITGPGLRRVVRFGTRSGNIGTADLVAGRPTLDNPMWEYDACHDHFHFEGYAQYDLIDAATSSVLPIGVKHGFCLRDLGSWDGSVPAERCSLYDCDYQGLGVGCYDVYVPELDCQWVDITDVAPGEYELRVTVNSEARIQELDRSNNSASVRLLITADTVRVVPPNQ